MDSIPMNTDFTARPLNEVNEFIWTGGGLNLFKLLLMHSGPSALAHQPAKWESCGDRPRFARLRAVASNQAVRSAWNGAQFSSTACSQSHCRWKVDANSKLGKTGQCSRVWWARPGETGKVVGSNPIGSTKPDSAQNTCNGYRLLII
jgi:hypothetical protein